MGMSAMSKTKAIIFCVCVAGVIAVAAVCVKTWYKDRGREEKAVGSEEYMEIEVRDGAGKALETVRGAKATADLRTLLREAFLRGDTQEIQRLIPLIAGDDVTEILSLLHGMKPGWKFLRASISICAKNNPKATAAWAVTHLPKGGDRAFALHNTLWNWAAQDPHAALAWAYELSMEQSRECALRAVFAVWAKLDPEAAALQLEQIDDFATRSAAISRIAYYWASKDLRAATEWACNLPEELNRTCALANIARRLYDSDQQSAFAWAEKLPAGYARDATIHGIASLLALEDTETTAALLARQIPGGMGPDPAFQIRIADWASKDPDGAATWAGQLSDDRLREHALSTVAQALASIDPKRASAIAETIPDGAKKNSTFHRIGFYWANWDIDSATEWAEQLQDGQARENALEGIESVKDEPDPEGPDEDEPKKKSPEDEPKEKSPMEEILAYAKKEWRELKPLVEQLPDGPLRDGLAHRTAVEMAPDEGSLASAAWIVEQLPEGDVLDRALKVVIWNWVAKDKATGAASEWINQLPEGPTRESALSSLGFAEKHGAGK